MGACYLPDQIRCFITLPISDVELASPAASECVYPLWDVRSRDTLVVSAALQ